MRKSMQKYREMPSKLRRASEYIHAWYGGCQQNAEEVRLYQRIWLHCIHLAHRKYAAKLFLVNTGKEPSLSFIEVHPNCSNCNLEISVFIYSSGALLVVILKCGKLLFRYRVRMPNFYYSIF